MSTRLTCAIACLLLSFAATAQVPDQGRDGEEPDPQVAQAYRSYYGRAAAALAADGTPRGLAIAAMLLQLSDGTPAPDAAPDDDTPSQDVPTDPRIAQWRQRASARAGNDVVANALLAWAHVGAEPDAALRRAATARWRSAEPDNLAPRLALAGDIAALLADSATLSRLDLHYLDQTRAVAAGLRAHPPTDAERALLVDDGAPLEEFATLSASALVAALALPSLKPLFDACGGPALQAGTSRADDCRRVAESMRTRSDTSFGESVGLSLARRMAATPLAIAEVDAAGRRYAWRMQQWSRLAAAQPRDGAADYVRLLADPAIDSERQVAEHVLRTAGVALEPPTGWQPSRGD